jgi:hypothetical protein
MKHLLTAVFVLLMGTTYAQHSLEKIWQTDSTLNIPESVLYDAKGKILYVANMADSKKPGSGGISKVGLDGKIIKTDWVTGLTAAKGMGLYKNLLYAAELTTVAVIDVNTATVIKRITVEGAKFLNDITIDEKGIIYVTDSQTGSVHQITDGKASVYLENLKGINGVLSVGTDLYVLADGALQKVDAQKNVTTLAKGMEGGTDGVVKVGANEFIVTGWAGTIYYVKADGSTQVLSDTRDKKMSTADLAYNAAEKIIYVPTFAKNSVIAFKVK